MIQERERSTKNKTAACSAAVMLLLFASSSPALAGICTTAQKNTIANAFSKAKLMLPKAIADLPSVMIEVKPNYEAWFGTYEATRRDRVKSVLQATLNHINATAISSVCFADNEDRCAINPKMGAGVAKNDPTTMYFCSRYFDNNVANERDRPSLVIHEVTHYEAVAGTSDHCDDNATCLALAKNQPETTTASAGSYQGYVWNYY